MAAPFMSPRTSARWVAMASWWALGSPSRPVSLRARAPATPVAPFIPVRARRDPRSIRPPRPLRATACLVVRSSEGCRTRGSSLWTGAAGSLLGHLRERVALGPGGVEPTTELGATLLAQTGAADREGGVVPDVHAVGRTRRHLQTGDRLGATHGVVPDWGGGRERTGRT